MTMADSRKSLKRTVFYDEETGELCSCDGNFWKTCSLRVKNQLPCQEAIITITPIQRDEKDPAEPGTRSIDSRLANLSHALRHLEDKIKI